MKKIFILPLLLVNISISKAQSILYDNSFFNLTATNPAMAGVRKNFNLNATTSSFLTNGNISNMQQVAQIISLDGQVGKNTNGLGFQAYNSNFAGFGSQGLLADYAYRVPVGDVASLALGIRGGLTFASIGGITSTFPYAGGGAVLSGDDFFIGISQPVIVSKAVKNGISGSFLPNEKAFFASAGYSLEPTENLMFNPSIQYEMNKISGNALMINAKLWFSRKAAIGASFKSRNSASKIIGIFELQTSKSIRVGVSYDSKPYAGIQTSASIPSTGSIFQLFLRFESISDRRENTNRLGFF